MSYLVLARKWRPQRFDDIVGQAHVTRVLQNAIRLGRIAHAYLFTGVRGVGKTTAARILAKALNCEKGPTPEPCNECAECRGIMGGNSIDVYEIDGASNTSVEDVRDLIENARYQPAKSRFKIYIIDEVHQISRHAFNALLKTLEEPPPFVKFILATTEPHRLPETILSRCQRFDFRRIPVREICQRLRVIADTEQLSITDGALVLLAREAEGSMRDAQSLLEQVLSYAAPSSAEADAGSLIDEELLQGLLGIAERKTLYDLSASVLAGDANRCVELVAELADQGRDLPRFSRDLVEHFRNLLVVRLLLDRGPETGDRGLQSSVFGRLLDLPDQEIADLKLQASELSVETLMDYFSFMAEGDEETARSAYPRFALEAAVVRLAKLPKTMPVTAVLERLEALERKLQREVGNPAPVRPVDTTVGNEKSIHGAAPDSPAREGGTEQWNQFVGFVTREKKFLGTYLERAFPLELSPSQLKLGVEDRHCLSQLQDPENLSSLREFARRFFTGEISVSVVPVSGKSPAPEATPALAVGPAASRSEPGIGVQDVLEVFGGLIVKKEG